MLANDYQKFLKISCIDYLQIDFRRKEEIICLSYMCGVISKHRSRQCPLAPPCYRKLENAGTGLKNTAGLCPHPTQPTQPLSGSSHLFLQTAFCFMIRMNILHYSSISLSLLFPSLFAPFGFYILKYTSVHYSRIAAFTNIKWSCPNLMFYCCEFCFI